MYQLVFILSLIGSIGRPVCSLTASLSVHHNSGDASELSLPMGIISLRNLSDISRGRVVSEAIVNISCGWHIDRMNQQRNSDAVLYFIKAPGEVSCDVSSGINSTDEHGIDGLLQFSARHDIEAYLNAYFSKSFAKLNSEGNISFIVNITTDRQPETRNFTASSAHLDIQFSDPKCDISRTCNWENNFIGEDFVWKGSSSCSDMSCKFLLSKVRTKGKVIALRRRAILTVVSPPIMRSGKGCSLGIDYVLEDYDAAMVVKVMHDTYTRIERLPPAQRSASKLLHLGEIGSAFRIQLQIGANRENAAAILERIVLSNCHDNLDNATDYIPSNLYQCRGAALISRKQLCDGVSDCPQGDDESQNCKGVHVCELGDATCLSSVGKCAPSFVEARFTGALADSKGNFTGRVVEFSDERCIIKWSEKKEVLFRTNNFSMPYRTNMGNNCSVLISVFTQTSSIDVYACDADGDVYSVSETEACQNVWNRDNKIHITQWQSLHVHLSDFMLYLESRNATSYFLVVKIVLSDEFVIFDRLTLQDGCYRSEDDFDVEVELSSYTDQYIIVFVSCGISFIVLLLIFVLLLYRKSFQRYLVMLGCWIEKKDYKNPMLPYKLSYECPLLDNMNENHPYYPWCHGTSYSHCVTDDIKDLSRCKVKLIRPLGKGAFGEVYEGTLTKDGKKMMAAIKKLPDDCTAVDKKDFLLESFTISKFKHRNIISCLGIRFDKECPLLVLELMLGGDMKTFLRESRPTMDEEPMLSFPELLTMASDVARGCEYLQSCKFIHRDIAARNCLLTSKDSDRIAKIADFGMARDVIATNYYRKCGRAALPVRWMPPESFKNGIFSAKSDVWAYGVLLWEIFSFGRVPYGTELAQAVMMIKIENGHRLEQPEHCPNIMYEFMLGCWEENPDDRPDFQEICKNLFSLHKTSHISSSSRSKTLTLSLNSTDIRNSASIAESDDVFEDTV